MATIVIDNTELDHLFASEQHRLQTFDSLTRYSSTTRRQLALAGFIYRQSECVCPQCGVKINLERIDENAEYASNYFRKLHRKEVSRLGRRCSFLLCESGTNIDNLHPPLTSQQQPLWDDAEEPEYISFTKRLESLETWPDSQEQITGAQKTFVTPQAMAKHGFYYSGPKDGVTCFYCGNTLVDWSEAMHSTNENIVQLEHSRFFPCRFVTYTAGGKFVANAGYFHTVSAQERCARNPMSFKSSTNIENTDHKPRTIDECLATFTNWPRYAPVSAQALADTGFYYLGEDLRVKCFMCGLEVDDWRHGMTALGTHRKRRSECELVRAIDSTKTGDIQTAYEKWRLETLLGLSFADPNVKNPDQSEIDQRLCRELAACGFYRFKNTRIIRCAYCGVTIEPKLDQSIMSQHRQLTKQSGRKTTTAAATTTTDSTTMDCLMVRAQCPANVVIPHRERFPEYPAYQSIFDRMETFETYKGRHKHIESSARDLAEAGFFLNEKRRKCCFQCGNSLPITEKVRQEKYPQYNMAQLHAHFYPTCEWVKEILGVKYIAQVLHDRYKSNEPQTQISLNAQSSSSSSTATATTTSTIGSFSSVLNTPSVLDVTSPSTAHRFDEPFISDQSAESSDDESFVTVARPSTTQTLPDYFPLRSPPPQSATILHEALTTMNAQPCSDPIITNGHTQLTSPSVPGQMNPFKELHLRQQQQNGQLDDHVLSNGNPPEISPGIAVSSPVDIRALHAHEMNRLETFKKQNREIFANVECAHLAYVGFYLNAEGNLIQCPWCDVKLTEQEFENIVRTRPSVARSALSDEPWTPMRVHRHANGILMDQNHPWCTWVRREAGGLYPNVTIAGSQMLYPEYPSYANTEKRIKSFSLDWTYPSGSRLSNQMMAEAGFFNMGGGSVCCYYCGNKLQNFEPRDCPFEEHATFYPLCDFIQRVRGLDYVNRIILECGRIPQGRLKYEMDGTQKIKRIVFDKSGATKRKSERPPVNRINSTSSRSSTRPIPRLEIIDDACLICSANPATHEYDPCHHCPMCGECFARLDQEQLKQCMHCFKPATICMRVPNTPLIP